MDDSAMINSCEAARIIGVTENTLRQSRFTGRLHGRPAPPYYRLSYRTLKYHKRELEQWRDGDDYPPPAVALKGARMTAKQPALDDDGDLPALCTQG